MGRALWLRGRHDQSVVELDRAIDLSPNFALGHYTLAFVHSQTGDPAVAISSTDHAHIFAIAAYSLALAGSLDEARAHAAAIHRMVPRYGIADFIEAFRFDTHGVALFRKGAKRIGMT